MYEVLITKFSSSVIRNTHQNLILPKILEMGENQINEY